MKTLYYWQDHEGHRYDLYSCPNQQSPSLSPVQLDLTEPWFPQRKLNLIICRWFWRVATTVSDSQETWGASLVGLHS